MSLTETQQKDLDWLVELLGADDIETSSLTEGFVLLQLLSLISPKSIDLSWYTTPAAFNCPNLPLRNFVVLSRAIKELKSFYLGNEAKTSRPGSSTRSDTTTKTRPDRSAKGPSSVKIWSPLKEVSEISLQKAKAGDVVACFVILAALRTVFERQHESRSESGYFGVVEDVFQPSEIPFDADIEIQNEDGISEMKIRDEALKVTDDHRDDEKMPAAKADIQEESNLKKPEDSNNVKIEAPSKDIASPNDDTASQTELSQDELEMEPYVPAEKIFSFFVDWLLSVEKGPNSKSIQEKLKSIRPNIPYEAIFYLCSTELYTQVHRELRGDTNESEESDNETDQDYLDSLISDGYLHIQDSMLSSVKEMVKDTSPFYESLHTNIIAALMSFSQRDISVDSIVVHLSQTFPSFDVTKSYPFDLEDAALIWVNQCIQQLPIEMDNIEELGREFDERCVLAILMIYFPEMATAQLVESIKWNGDQRRANEKLFKKTLRSTKYLPAPKWSFKDFDGELPTKVVPLYLTYLVDLFRVCDGKGLSQILLKDEENPAQHQMKEAERNSLVAQPPSLSLSLKPRSGRVTKLRDRKDETAELSKSHTAPSTVFEQDNEMTVPSAGVQNGNQNQTLEENKGDQNDLVEAQAEATISSSDDPFFTALLTDTEQLGDEEEEEDNEKPPESTERELAAQRREQQEFELQIENQSKPPIVITQDSAVDLDTLPKDENYHTEGLVKDQLKEPARQHSHEFELRCESDQEEEKQPPNAEFGDVSKITIQSHMKALLLDDEGSYDEDTGKESINADIMDRNFMDEEYEQGEHEAEDKQHVMDLRSHEEDDDGSSEDELDRSHQKETHVITEIGNNQTNRSPSVHSANPPPTFTNETLTHIPYEEASSDEDEIQDTPPSHLPPQKHARTPSLRSQTSSRSEQHTFSPVFAHKKVNIETTDTHVSSRERTEELPSISSVSSRPASHLSRSSKSRPQSIVFQNYPLPEERAEDGFTSMEPVSLRKASRSTSRADTFSLPPIPNVQHNSVSTLSDPSKLEPSNISEESWIRAQKTRAQKMSGKEDASKSQSPRKDHPQEDKRQKLELLQQRKAQRDEERLRQKQALKEQQEQQKREFIENSLQNMQERALRRASKSSHSSLSPEKDNSLKLPPIAGAIAKEQGKSSTTTAQETPSKKKVTRPVSKPQSNRVLIRNALTHLCLAGTVKEGVKQEVMEDLENCNASHFIILFRERNNFSFRGLYSWDPLLDQTVKVHSGSLGPNVIDPNSVLEYYKYDSGARTFKPVPTKTFGRSVHAVAISRDQWTK